MAILSAKDLSISFGSNHVLRGVSFEVAEDEILGIIGPNGAGKTVLLNVLSGILRPNGGVVTFLSRNITNMKIVDRVRLGMARTFQIPRSFEHMTAYENVLVGGVYGDRLSEKESGFQAMEILENIGLHGRYNDLAGTLGLLDRKRLEIGIAMASRPKLLMIDEVAAGLTESEIAKVIEIVQGVKAQGASVIWIEHVLQTMVDGTDRVMCLSEGKGVITGLPYEVLQSKVVSDVYLGVDDDE
jgi:branched-chain amino acid transport system ATP-binding protein